MQCSTSKDSVENKIESEFQDFKDVVLVELQEIKAKIESSRTIQNRITSDVESNKTLQVNNNKETINNTISPLNPLIETDNLQILRLKKNRA